MVLIHVTHQVSSSKIGRGIKFSIVAFSISVFSYSSLYLSWNTHGVFNFVIITIVDIDNIFHIFLQVVLENQLIQVQEVCTDLREDLSRTKNDCLHLQGTKSGLQQRMSDQEEKLSQLKAELLRRDFEKQSLESEKVILPFNISKSQEFCTVKNDFSYNYLYF